MVLNRTPATREDRYLLTVEEAAQKLGISRAHLYTLLQRGEVPSVHLGRSRRISVRALQDWIDRLAADSGAQATRAAVPSELG